MESASKPQPGHKSAVGTMSTFSNYNCKSALKLNINSLTVSRCAWAGELHCTVFSTVAFCPHKHCKDSREGASLSERTFAVFVCSGSADEEGVQEMVTR